MRLKSKRDFHLFVYLCYSTRYAGYDCMVAPPVCKIKKKFNRWDPYEIMSDYQRNYMYVTNEKTNNFMMRSFVLMILFDSADYVKSKFEDTFYCFVKLVRFHPEESYSTPVQALKPDDFDKMGIATNPINTLAKMPLPDAQRLSCYLECNLPECPRANTEMCRTSSS